MIRINLLPWREQARQQKKILFGYTVAAFSSLTVVFLLFVHLHYSNKISRQLERNQFLNAETGNENQILSKLNDQLAHGTSIDSDLHFLTSLRNKSYQAVTLLDQLARVVPDTVTLTQISRDNHSVTLFGKAISNYQITLMMKNIVKSASFNQPTLDKINSDDNADKNATFFKLNVIQKG